MQTLKIVNFVIAVIFLACYAYQYFYIPLVWFKKKKPAEKKTDHKPGCLEKPHDYAILICARNERNVIADLIRSIQNQTYPAKHIVTFVMADNCTDDTARVAREAGAFVYERFNQVQVGKGYAMDRLLKNIKADFGDFDAYLVFDADNILAPDYVEKIDLKFSEGNDIVTSYRNSKNYGSNWISSGYALWFLRESKYLNCARDLLGTSCAVSGTGFLFSRAVAEEIDGWPFHLLTEDIEFSIDQIIKGRKIAFCGEAEFYDEQPIGFRQSWRQRRRWAKGYFQVFGKYGRQLISGMLHGSFACFDMSMNIMPAFILSMLSIVCSIGLGIWGAAIGDDVRIALKSVGETLGGAYLMLFAIGLITALTEWKHIHATRGQKLRSIFTFPLFMFTYLPIAFSAMFGKTTWKPITHTCSCGRISSGEPAKLSEVRKIA